MSLLADDAQRGGLLVLSVYPTEQEGSEVFEVFGDGTVREEVADSFTDGQHALIIAPLCMLGEGFAERDLCLIRQPFELCLEGGKRLRINSVNER
jgi:hypothetical protein